MSNQPVYKIIFHNGKQIFEVFAKHIYQSDMWGFVEIDLQKRTGLLGDLILCDEVINREALDQAKPREHHWAHITIHGVLHLLGYDHIDEADAEVMEALEIEKLDGLAIPNPYNA